LTQKEEGRIRVAVLGNNIYIEATGYATQSISLGLPDFLETMFHQGCTSVTFDLKGCLGMDSTFLGVIASAAMSRHHGGERAVIVLNADEKLMRELRIIGLLPVVAVKEGKCEPPEGLELAQIDFVHMPGTERERLLSVKRLHQELLKLNEANKRRFAAFVEMLEEELRQNPKPES